MPGIGIIANPHSKLNKRNPAQGEMLGYILGQKGQLRMTNSLAELAQVAKEFKRQAIDILAINGGDGTVSRTITAFVQAYGDEPLPPVALLKGGTMNAVAGNLGLRGGPEEILYRLVEAFSSHSGLRLQPIRTLVAEGSSGFIFANGAATNFLREFYKDKSGPLGALKLILKTYWYGVSKNPRYADIISSNAYALTGPSPESSEVALTQHSVCMMAATVPKLPLGAPLFSRKWLGPNEIRLASFIDDPRDLLWRLPAYLLSGWRDPRIFKRTYESLEVGSDSPFWYTIDGELFESQSNTVRLTLGRSIDFVVV